MSLKKGNELFQQGRYAEAVEEYNEIDISSPLYEHVQFNILLAKRRMGEPAPFSEEIQPVVRPDKPIGYYRILGNSIGDLHVDDQAYTNLMHIVEHESDFDGVDKWFILNRLVDKNDQNKIVEYLHEHSLNYKIIDFELEEYKKIGYDFAVLPDSAYWFTRKSSWAELIANAAIRKQKNSYLMNNNGARNFALQHGKKRYAWTLPWDGNCFLSDPQFTELEASFTESGPYKYVCIPMERVVDNVNITSISLAINAVEEPQIAFRFDSKESFNEKMVYGNKPKVELFRRLGYPGKWDEFEKIYPWETWTVEPSNEAGQYIESASVFRLSSGNTDAANSGSNRARTRAQGIADTIDEVESLYIRKNIETGSYIQIMNNVFVSYLNQQDIEKLKNAQAFTFENYKDALLFTLFYFVEDQLDSEIVDRINVDFSINYEGCNLKNIETFADKFYKNLIAMLIAISTNNVHTSVKFKLELAMMFYFYFSHKSVSFSSKELEFFMQLTEVLFDRIFEYDIAHDLSEVGVNYNLKRTSTFLSDSQGAKCTFLSKRSDGFGERIRSLLNAMALAEYYKTDFKFQWEERNGKAKQFHSIISREETFHQDFLNQYHLGNICAVDIKDIDAIDSDIHSLKEHIHINIHQNLYKSRNPIISSAFKSVDFKRLFNEIKFSDELESARNEAEKVALENNTIALHLRAGDIVYGNFRYTDRFSNKALPYTVAEMLISKLKEMKLNILLFGQDSKLCHWLCDQNGIKYAEDYAHISFNNEQKSIFEIVLMSRCEKVYGGSSGFSILATMIGDIERIDPKNVFGTKDSVVTSLKILEQHVFNDFIPPMQVAYACNWVLSRGKTMLSDHDYFYLTDLGLKMDPENPMFVFLKAWKLYNLEQFTDAENFLSPHLIDSETYLAKFLEKAALSKHSVDKFVVDFMSAFEIAMQKGYPVAAKVLDRIKNTSKHISIPDGNGVFAHSWDVTYNLGIKCNALSISREGGVRYFSSPFDNIDTVEGIEEIGNLIASKFENYFDDINQWKIKNQYVKNSDEVLTKIIWHVDTPNVYYPHFNERWLSGQGLTPDGLEAWISSRDLDINPIFDDIKKLFSARQQRLVTLLEHGVDMLFIRIDERRSLKRISPTNTQKNLANFIDTVKEAYPQSNLKVLYFYCDNDGSRQLKSTDEIECVLIPDQNDPEADRLFVIDKLKTLKIKPRENLLNIH